MKTHNKRFPKIWKIITEHVDFEGKRLLDIGCGYGDLIKAAHDVGATVYGVDNNKDITRGLTVESPDRLKTGRFYVVYDDIEDWTEDYLPFRRSKGTEKIDIVTCFSVLPYLEDPEYTLSLFPLIAPIAILEVQYFGDGPGVVAGDGPMKTILEKYFNKVEKIGSTRVDFRNKERSIWLCLR